MNKVIKLGIVYNEGEGPDFGTIQQHWLNPNNLYLLAQDIPKLNGMLTRATSAAYLPEGQSFNFYTGALAYVVDYKTAGTGKIYMYHRGKDHWYEFNIRSDLGLCELMWNRHETILRETKTISGTPPLTFESNGRPLKNYRIYGNTVNGESVGDLVTEGEHAGEYCVPVTISRKAKHTATLQLHDCLPNAMQFDAPEALYYAENGLPAGTYCFTIQNYDITYGGGQTYNFTLTHDVPVGGQLTYDWGYNTQAINAKITSYASNTSTTVIEQVSVSEGSVGIELGTTDGNSTNVNHIHRVRYGSNNYGESAIIQFLNSSANAGNVWTPKTIFDRPPAWNASMEGFMKDIDSDFLASVGVSHKVTSINSISDSGGFIVLEDKFFMLSRSEVYGSSENDVNEGNPYPYYSDYSDLSAAGTGNDSNRIKYRNDAAQSWWLRSCSLINGNVTRSISTVGAIGGSNAYNNIGVTFACNIELDEEYKYQGHILHVRDQITITKGNDTLVFDVIGIDHDDVDFDIITINLYFPEQLKMVGDESDYIDYKEQKQYYADGSSVDVTLPTIHTFSGTNTMSIGTTVHPSNIIIKGRIETVQ